jgi:hypothetical protein
MRQGRRRYRLGERAAILLGSKILREGTLRDGKDCPHRGSVEQLRLRSPWVRAAGTEASRCARSHGTNAGSCVSRFSLLKATSPPSYLTCDFLTFLPCHLMSTFNAAPLASTTIAAGNAALTHSVMLRHWPAWLPSDLGAAKWLPPLRIPLSSSIVIVMPALAMR